jgi:cholesterol oxidase
VTRLSRPLAEAADEYTAIVIGSGYGGSIAASRLARAGQRVCLLERGSERVPGEFPATLADLRSEIKMDTVHGRYGRRRAMFDVRMNGDISALVGCGLGGTSLINANVSLPPLDDVFGLDGWPETFRSEPGQLEPYYETARRMLGATPYPEDWPALNKLDALVASAAAIGAPCIRPPINVNFRDQVNPFGVYQPKCTNCGDCCSGCNYGAKNTTLMNYLPDAANHGAEIFTNASVERIERAGDRWLVHVGEVPDVADGPSPHPITEPTPVRRTIAAAIVVVAAGTLGSTEILIRSREHGLPLSDALGHGFSGNGDVLAFGYDNHWKTEHDESGAAVPVAINGIGRGTNRLRPDQMPGPCITGVIDLRQQLGTRDGLVVEEGVIPGALAAVVPIGYFGGSALADNPFAYGAGEAEARLQDAASLASAIQHDPGGLAEQSYRGPVSRSQTYLVMSHDDASGRLELRDDRLRIDWPGAGTEKAFDHDNAVLRRVNAAIHGEFLANPMWSEATGRQLMTVHPVGGCRMADSWDDGVVDDRGRVWAGPGILHEGLYVCDGAILPGSISVNPLLTISALAERSMDKLVAERGWSTDTTVADARPGHLPFAGPRPGRPGQHVAPGIAGLVAAVLRACWWWLRGGVRRTLHALRSLAGRAISPVVRRIVRRDPDRYAPAMEFTETMEGWISTDVPSQPSARGAISDPFALAVARGQLADTPISFRLTLATDNLWTMATAADRPATATGWITCAALDPEPLHVVGGRFHLLPPDADRVETWIMTYDLPARRAAGTTLRFVGHKYLHKQPGSNPWTDLTRLFVTITDEQERLVAQGIMTLDLQDFVRQAATLELSPRREGIARFRPIGDAIERYFLASFAAGVGNTVLHAYGGILADLNNFSATYDQPAGRQRVRRPLRPSAEPVVPHPIKADVDGARLLLTRYGSGRRGPVVLAPGFSVRADSFAIDTVDENLVEFLCGRGYDVWTFAYRGSPDSGSSTTPFVIDDIALRDWPAALRHVVEVTGRPAQVVAHCVASMSVLMSLLRGTIDQRLVRHVVSSQLTLHPVVDWLNDTKADLGLVPLIEQLRLPRYGIDLTQRIDLRSVVLPAHPTKRQLGAKAIDTALWMVPQPDGEACVNPVCRRVFSVFGPSYTHAQLNFATHEAMLEMFGEIALRPFEQLADVVRQGLAVDAHGGDTYVTSANARRLAMPIDFVVGARNQIFLPETSQRTLDWLVDHNGPHHYTRHVFEDYAHMDLWIGRSANVDVFPYVAERLDAFND